jgi:cysteine desulfurase
MEAYLDNSATTKPSQPVIEAVTAAMRDGYFNPSSPYGPALAAEKRMDDCRALLLKHVQAGAGEVIFTAGGTEADNLAILGYLSAAKKPGKVLYTAVEHPAVKQSCLAAERMGHTAVSMPVQKDSTVDLTALAELLDESVHLICVMQVNNETGAIQPIREIASLRDRLCPKAAIHVDGVQGFMRVPFSMQMLNVQSYALSSHKLHGPKGVGALILQKGHRVTPREFGGGQEKGLRSGTENTPGVAGLYAAVETYPQNAADLMRKLKRRLYELLCENLPGVNINGPEPDSEACGPHILNVSFRPVRSETMLYALAGDGIYVSMGSACSSRRQKVSETLKAMNVPKWDAECAILFSLSPYTTGAEIDYTVERVKAHYQALSKFVRR